jgi:hypothetical protein
MVSAGAGSFGGPECGWHGNRVAIAIAVGSEPWRPLCACRLDLPLLAGDQDPSPLFPAWEADTETAAPPV